MNINNRKNIEKVRKKLPSEILKVKKAYCWEQNNGQQLRIQVAMNMINHLSYTVKPVSSRCFILMNDDKQLMSQYGINRIDILYEQNEYDRLFPNNLSNPMLSLPNYPTTPNPPQAQPRARQSIIFFYPPKLNQLACQFELALQLMNPSKSLPQSSPNSYSPLTSPNKPPTSLQSSPSSQPPNDEEYTLVVSQRQKPNPNPKHFPISSDLRIVQHNLILATGIMRELSSQKILQTNCYFGRYGQVTNSIISSKHSSFSAINQDIQVFVTYKNELDAAWAIAALKDISHHRSFIKIHYGTSRYCSKYINDEECTVKGCYFNHKYRPEHRHKNQLKELVDEQYDRVYRLINENLEYFVRKEYEDFKNKSRITKPTKCYCYGDSKDINFPSFKSTFERLIQQGKINSKRYYQIKNNIKEEISNKQKGLFSKKQNQYKEINKSEYSDQVSNFKQNNQDDDASVNPSNSGISPPSPAISSGSSSHDSSFEQIPLIIDQQQTNRITILKVASKLMGRQFRQSRFKFVPYLDLKTTLQQQRKLQSIISKQIINNC